MEAVTETRIHGESGTEDTRSVSVVVASSRTPQLLEACLKSLLPQCAESRVELIVARRGTRSDLDLLRQRFPSLRFVCDQAATDIPRLRGLGMTAATGDLVAVTEDHCVADPHWLASLADASQCADVVGGGMGNARCERALDCGAFFAEYGFFSWARRETADGVPLLTGANAAYSRRVVEDVARWASQGHWESVAHDRLAEKGCRFRFAPGARILQNATFSFGPFCVDRYRHGRDYARVRVQKDSHVARWLRLLGSPLLPGFLLWRVYRAAASENYWGFLRAIPFTAAFLTAWSVGEAVGYVTRARR